MKPLFLIACIAIVFASCKKDNSPVVVQGIIADNYTADAQQILARRIQAGEKVTGYDKAEFDSDELNKVLKLFQAVYDLHSPQTDTVFNISKIHTFPTYQLKYISLHLSGSNESTRILAGQPSGNSSFDNLLTTYGYTYKATLYPNFPFNEIVSAKNYNVFAIIPQLKQYPFILNAEPEGSIGDGNNITYARQGNNILLDFSIGSGDCPAGCINRTGWRFTIDNTLKARFTGRYSNR